MSGVLQNDRQTIVITFDVATNRPPLNNQGYFLCSDLVDSSTANAFDSTVYSDDTACHSSQKARNCFRLGCDKGKVCENYGVYNKGLPRDCEAACSWHPCWQQCIERMSNVC